MKKYTLIVLIASLLIPYPVIAGYEVETPEYADNEYMASAMELNMDIRDTKFEWDDLPCSPPDAVDAWNRISEIWLNTTTDELCFITIAALPEDGYVAPIRYNYDETTEVLQAIINPSGYYDTCVVHISRDTGQPATSVAIGLACMAFFGIGGSKTACIIAGRVALGLELEAELRDSPTMHALAVAMARFEIFLCT